MSKTSTVTEFILLGFSEVQELEVLHIGVFLMIYLLGLMGNLLIVTAVALDHHLHSPMYFFLMNLGILDLGSISVTIHKSIANTIMNTTVISYPGCITQVFLFFLFTAVEIFLLTIMAYDRYIAICEPLHYERIMNRRACLQMAAGAWISGIISSSLHAGNTFRLPFCHSNVIRQFFCEIPQLLKLSCSDTYLIEVGVLAFSSFVVLNCFAFILGSCVQICKTVLRIPSEQGRCKAFSTCLPHLIVFSLLIFTAILAYLNPISSSSSNQELLVGVLNAIMPPVMNPIIYSMRNNEIKVAVKNLIVWNFFTKI